MRRCWAEPLGSCDGGISGEHIVSAGLWRTEVLTVVGLPWCKLEPVTIGLASLTANILCRRHNSNLSPIDAAGAQAFDPIRKAAELTNSRRQIPARKWKIKRLEIDGLGLERWMLKTGINLAYSRQISQGTWEFDGTPMSIVPVELVEMAFGLRPLERPLGLYGLGEIGERVASSDEVAIATVLRETGDLVGFTFTFRGFRFFLRLTREPMPEVLSMPGHPEAAWREGAMMYHLQALQWKVGKAKSHYCQLIWPDRALSPFTRW